MRPELLQSRHHNLGQMALAETVGDLDGLVQLAFAQRSRNRRRELPASAVRAPLKAIKRSIMTPMDHADIMNSIMTTIRAGHTHLCPHGARIETDRSLRALPARA